MEPVSSDGFADDGNYQIRDVPLGTRRQLRVVCIGAGYSGVLLAIIVSQKMQGHNVDFQIYEMNHDLGGTWLKNRQAVLYAEALKVCTLWADTG
jgi:hypothetical protein